MKRIRDQELETKFIQTVLGIGENDGPGRLNAELATQQITEDCFTEPGYWDIYQKAKELSQSGTRLDVVSVGACFGDERRRTVSSVWPEVPGFASLRVLGGRLIELRNRRAASEIGRRIVREAESYSEGFGESLVRAAASLQRSFSSDGSGVEAGRDVLLRFYEDLERAQGIGNEDIVPTGIGPFDEIVGGLPKSFVSIIGAYPGCFKSGIMGTIAGNAALSGRRVGFFSLEDNPKWLAKRFVSRETGIPVQDLARRKLRRDELERVASTQDRVVKIVDNIVFDGRSGLSGYDVAASSRYMISVHGCELIVIDHIGEMRSAMTRKDRYDLEVSENVRAVRDVAKDCGVAVLMAAHLKRKQDSEEDIYRIPKMTDFSDSSGIEKMCRLALGLWQPPDNQEQVALKVLKMNEGGARGMTFNLTKDKMSALVKNT